MSGNGARSMVLLAGGLMVAIIGIRPGAFPDQYRAVWAAGVITLFLSLLADISPQVAGPAAVLVLLAVYWKHRGVLGSVVPSAPGSSSATAPQTAGAGR